jgi:hypothetical protein
MTYTSTTILNLIADACQVARSRMDLNISSENLEQAVAYEAALREVESVFKESFTQQKEGK